MANSSSQIPQHVSALLSHLTSRPGVQSTLILSRKDGSIIQTTGLLAPPKPTKSETSSPVPANSAAEDATAATATATTATTSTPTSPSAEPPQPSTTSLSPAQTKPYQPSQAEAIAAHIFAFVSSASNLSFSLSHPLDGSRPSPSSNGIHEAGLGNGNGNNGSAVGTGRDDAEGESSEGQDDDEVKLLRLRTKKHEIVVVPDRKYLLCVVQDATPNAASGGASLSAGIGGRSSR
ncbi:hypothetical protein BDW62DRAFT_61758 [Aspergillus aurantiobrunneus]